MTTASAALCSENRQLEQGQMAKPGAVTVLRSSCAAAESASSSTAAPIDSSLVNFIFLSDFGFETGISDLAGIPFLTSKAPISVYPSRLFATL
jgi:hypothetical protein